MSSAIGGTTTPTIKRKSRFADATNNITDPGISNNDGNTAPPQQQPNLPVKRSRWGAAPTPSADSKLTQQTTVQLELWNKQARVELLSKQLLMPSIAIQSAEYQSRARSPSPEPIYDKSGQRINTREQRLIDKLSNERDQLIHEIQLQQPHCFYLDNLL